MYEKGREAYVRILEELGRNYGTGASDDPAASDKDIVDAKLSSHVADEL